MGLINIPSTMPQDNYEKFMDVDRQIPIFDKADAINLGLKWYKSSNRCLINHKDFDMEHPEYRWLSGGCIVYYLFKRTPCPRCHAPNKIYRTHRSDPDYICEDCRKELRWASQDIIEQARSYSASYVRNYKKQINYTCEFLDIKLDTRVLEVHHKFSVNTHPELAAEYDNMIGLYKPIHQDFHNIYGRGNNTPEQLNEYRIRNKKTHTTSKRKPAQGNSRIISTGRESRQEQTRVA